MTSDKKDTKLHGPFGIDPQKYYEFEEACSLLKMSGRNMKRIRENSKYIDKLGHDFSCYGHALIAAIQELGRSYNG